MKELSIEEKAKFYDEAKARMSRAYNDNRCTIGFMNEIFPELKENEDERVRNKLIEFFKGYSPDEEWWGNITQEDILAWLEKKGEQKTVDEIAKKVCKNKTSAMAFLKSTGIINEKGELADEYKIEQDEQNPVWSKEDKDYYDAIIAKLEVTQDDALLTDNQIKFLKSLKDKIQSQPQWKPSGEQMEGIECTIKTLRYQLNAGDNRLDSLYNDLKKLREK